MNIPFRQLLELVRKLNPRQKAQLKAELDSALEASNPETPDFLKVVASGPVYADADVKKILDNRKSIQEWRSNP